MTTLPQDLCQARPVPQAASRGPAVHPVVLDTALPTLELTTNPGHRKTEEPRQHFHSSPSQASRPAAGVALLPDTSSVHRMLALRVPVGSFLGLSYVLGRKKPSIPTLHFKV